VTARLPVAYVGATGSRRTRVDRLERLRSAGLDASYLARLHSPLGRRGLGARPRPETAPSILAEVVSGRTGGSGAPLSRTGGAIPRGDAPDPPLPLQAV
jgi:xanthine dehydrogenase accessory factor